MRHAFRLVSIFFLTLSLMATTALPFASAQESAQSVAATQADPITIHFFGREDRRFCKAEKEFLGELLTADSHIELQYYDVIKDSAAKTLYNEVTKANNVARVTPITLIGHSLIQGFDSAETTGKLISAAIDGARGQPIVPIQTFINQPELTVSGVGGAGCTDNPEDPFAPCETGASEFVFTLPFVGAVDLQTFSLSSLAVVLGFVDGFNPCAMWVLVTFLLILLQIGDRRRMFQVAGLFILAEAIMYNLILNVWYQAWDFVGLDAIVTPLVGLIAIGGGLIFLRKYWKNRDQGLVCDVTDASQKGKIEKKLQKIATSPMTIVGALGIMGISFSVNVIEFACSVGIPQAFTKILDLNNLSMMVRQTYIGLYTLFYMVDDFIVFGLALWGINKMHLTSRYANVSALIGGILMLILGALLIFAPTIL